MANMMSITIGETKFVWPSYASTSEDVKVLPITVGDAFDVCMSDDGETTRSITWEFR